MASPSRGLVSIIIPTLNEEFGIEKTISSIPKSDIHDRLGYDIEIIVIDGNSFDSTRDVALKMGAKVILEKRKGYGRAYKTGFNCAVGDIIITIDADDTYPAKQIPEYIRQLTQKELDFITINRFSRMEAGAMTFTRTIGNKILAFVMNLLYSVNIRDSQSGMWIMKKSFISSINLNSDEMSMSEEIKIIAFKFFKSLELDGTYFTRTGVTKLDTFRHGWLNLKYLFHYRRLIKFALINTATSTPPPSSSNIHTKEIYIEHKKENSKI
jgi:dolichol-phosphate hexosyltransferase